MTTETSKEITIPTRVFSSIIPNLITVLKHTQNAEGVVTAEAKQALLQATNDLKGTIAEAKDYATALSGGELNFEDQDKLISVLERLQDHKRWELTHFAHNVTKEISPIAQELDSSMEVDSTASTPFGS